MEASAATPAATTRPPDRVGRPDPAAKAGPGTRWASPRAVAVAVAAISGGGGGGGSQTCCVERPGSGGGGSSFISPFATNPSGPVLASSSGSGTVSLSYAAPTADVSTTPQADALSFGTVPQGSSSPQQIVTVTNNGAATLLVSGYELTGNDPGDYLVDNECQSPVAPASSWPPGRSAVRLSRRRSQRGLAHRPEQRTEPLDSGIAVWHRRPVAAGTNRSDPGDGTDRSRRGQPDLRAPPATPDRPVPPGNRTHRRDRSHRSHRAHRPGRATGATGATGAKGPPRANRSHRSPPERPVPPGPPGHRSHRSSHRSDRGPRAPPASPAPPAPQVLPVPRAPPGPAGPRGPRGRSGAVELIVCSRSCRSADMPQPADLRPSPLHPRR